MVFLGGAFLYRANRGLPVYVGAFVMLVAVLIFRPTVKYFL